MKKTGIRSKNFTSRPPVRDRPPAPLPAGYGYPFPKIGGSLHPWTGLVTNGNGFMPKTAAERINSRLEFVIYTIRGMKKMKVRSGLALCVMLAMAIGRVKEKQGDRIRSLVKAAQTNIHKWINWKGKNPRMRIVDNGWLMPFSGSRRNMLDLIRSKGPLYGNPYIKQGNLAS
ncbi:hypothetical protein [Caldibacillus debilis]|uniref:hypothetical protein n=1 Tax=Caldibacillus debilis TaxID=301148 RepID=UPI0023F23ACD|nr:hypothetical protein [Caldibacillus debilis]